MRIRKGDRVIVRTGKWAGQRGEVIKAMPEKDQVVLEGINIAKRATKQQGSTMQAGIIDKFMPVSVSSVAIVCGSCGPTRIGMRIDEQGRKLRVCRKCGADL